MIRILVVDSNITARHKMKDMINVYASENQIQVSIFEAETASEAVMMCFLENCEIVFLNTELSEMSSIDTIYKIREHNANTLIIGVLNDRDEFRKKVSSYGAEDYLAKPLNYDIFKIRMDIYTSLIKSRRAPVMCHNGYNVYKEDVLVKTISFFIQERDALIEFWEHYLLDEKKDGVIISDLVRILFRFAESLIKLQIRPTIWIEESSKYLYFTMDKISFLSSTYINIVFENNPNITEYKIESDKITIKCLLNEKNVLQKFQEKQSISIMKEFPSIEEFEEISKPIIEELHVDNVIHLVNGNKIFDYMDQEHLEDAKEFISKLRSLLLIASNGDIETEEIYEIAYYLKNITKTLSLYGESYAISRALGDLAATVEMHVNEFIEKSKSMGKFYASFGSDLTQWVQMSFYDGAPSVNFMDDTIISNATMLGSMLNITVQDTLTSQDEFDDIFDF